MKANKKTSLEIIHLKLLGIGRILTNCTVMEIFTLLISGDFSFSSFIMICTPLKILKSWTKEITCYHRPIDQFYQIEGLGL
jgi:hypothetical protein